MAIQNRRGNYEDFVPSKMLPGEFAVVQNGDPNSTDGKAVYMAFQTGDVRRLATYKELQTEVSNAAEEIAQDITDDFEQQITPLVNSASQSASNASASATQAQNIVNSAVSTIQTAGATQVTAVQAKGDEVLESIPADYTDLSDDVTALKADFILQIDEIPDTVQSYTFVDGTVSQITHNRSGVAIRTDVFTYGTNTITEVRTLSTGESLAIVTNLTTLETTVTYAAA